jgi:hypothetical protein
VVPGRRIYPRVVWLQHDFRGTILSNAIVGAWLVKEPAAPFPYHMYVFNADGTMQQANPDAGDKTTSDSDGKGVWIAEGQQIRGKWVEVAARLISSLDVVNSHSTSSLTATAFRDQQCFGLTT